MGMSKNITRERKVYTVSRLNQEVQKILESGFGTLWLQGELSNFSRPGSGHFYFTIKDSQSQIRCAMFKGRNRYVDFKPDNGDAVLLRGKLGLYAARGEFQLIVEHMEPAGAGKLQAAFEATKQKLDALGWFDVARKKTIPNMPATIGVVTSPTSAALRDVLNVLARRYRQSQIIIYPTLTQGAEAAPGICKALQSANSRNEVDVLLLVRGGGSLEDLWAFNEQSVANAIHDSHIPIVSGIGHEVDITISDLVSDLRGPTPSAAAELATPDNTSLHQRVDNAFKQLCRLQQRMLENSTRILAEKTLSLHRRHPQRLIREQSQKLDEMESRLQRNWQLQLAGKLAKLSSCSARLTSNSPSHQLQKAQNQLQSANERLGVAIDRKQTQCKSRFELLARALHSVSPMAVLDRGYALVKKQDRLVLNAASLLPGDKVTTKLANGEFSALVSAVSPGEPSGKATPDNPNQPIEGKKK